MNHDLSQSSPANEPDASASPLPDTRRRDAFVPAAIGLVALALMLGLYMQLDTGLPLAFAVAVLLAASLMLLDVLYKRNLEIAELRGELARVARADRRPAPPAPMQSRPAPAQPASGATPPRMPARPVFPAQAPGQGLAGTTGGQLATSAAASWGRPTGGGLVDLQTPAALGWQPEPSPQGHAGEAAGSLPETAPNGAANAGRHAPASSSSSPASGAPAEQGRPAPAHAGSEQQSAAPAHRAPAMPPPVPVQASPWEQHKPGEMRAEVPSRNGAEPSGAGPSPRPAAAAGAAAGPPPLPTHQGRGAPPLPRRPASQADREMPADPGPSEHDLETMQNLIKQLAVQLNTPRSDVPPKAGGEARPSAASEAWPQPSRAPAPRALAPRSDGRIDASPPLPPSPEPALPEPTAAQAIATSVAESVATSVAALRATADSMRHAAEPTSAAAPPPAPRGAPPVRDGSPYGRLVDVTEALAGERIDVLLDPIHALGDRKARHFEVSVRLRREDGSVMETGEWQPIAVGTGLLPQIDAAKLQRTARVAERLRQRGAAASLFSSLSAEALVDDVFLDAFESAFADHDGLASRLVLSFVQADVRRFSELQWDAIAAMGEIGLHFSLEAVTDLDMDFARLKAHGFDFVKLDAQVFLQGLPAAHGAIPAPDICRHLADAGLSLIVGRIDDEMALAKILGFGVLFGQGALFGGPRPVGLDGTRKPAPSHITAAA